MENNCNCTNCGAPLIHSRFKTFCEFCGAVVFDDNNIASQSMQNSDIVFLHYKYINTNFKSIIQSPFVHIIKDNSEYHITSNEFYGNDGFLNRLELLSLSFYYENNNNKEELLFGIKSDRPAIWMALLLDDVSFSLLLKKQEHDTSWFVLPIDLLLSLCQAEYVDIDSDIKIESNTQFNELPIFASRFYNIVFDRMKFLYSVNIRLITDL